MTITMAGVWKTFGEGHTAVDALRDIDLASPQGEFTTILGPSGSGKTTLLNLVGAIDDATDGRIEVAGVDLDGLGVDELVKYRRENVGFVFQFFNLIPTLTALENVELVADLTADNGAERAAAVLERVGLADRVTHFPSQLSGGEQQRVAIARALVKEPPILLCDEPTGELDFETGRMVLDLLRTVSRELSQTVLLVTHNAAIGNMADRVLKLRSGEIVDDVRNEDPVAATELTW
ncbi:MAG: ABC transporter ATP-binding protein [Acidimicrobiia bacterium]|nr:ABC transporter ATP-binding protein [Acidimicrobiia bacterium]MDX2465923.1 ABC transporter ATP-binding protein [Acidimicrobiia bacterium]